MEINDKHSVKRARIFAIVLGLFTVISLISLVYAVYCKTEAKKIEVELLKQVEPCKKEVEYWKKLAQKDSLIETPVNQKK